MSFESFDNSNGPPKEERPIRAGLPVVTDEGVRVFEGSMDPKDSEDTALSTEQPLQPYAWRAGLLVVREATEDELEDGERVVIPPDELAMINAGLKRLADQRDEESR
jgi:hypothetical protein